MCHVKDYNNVRVSIRVSNCLEFVKSYSDECILSHVGYSNFTSSRAWAKIYNQPIRMKLNKFLVIL